MNKIPAQLHAAVAKAHEAHTAAAPAATPKKTAPQPTRRASKKGKK